MSIRPGRGLGLRAVGLLAGVLLDATLGDPTRWHPVAGFGRWAGWVERRVYRDATASGVGHVTICLAPVLAAAVAAERGRPAVRVLLTAATAWSVLGARQLVQVGERMAEHLDAAYLEAHRLDAAGLQAARALLPHLCGRLPDGLDAAELARATVESLAENTSDAVTGSLLWGAVLGVPGLGLHRGANTLDAMVGHRSPRYARFGTAAARLDDLVNLLPARMTGVTFCALMPLVGGDARAAWRVMLRDHAQHPSPNSGWCEAAVAGGLGVRLGGRNTYPGGVVEQRGHLGDAGICDADTVRRAARLVALATAGIALVTTLVLGAISGMGAR